MSLRFRKNENRRPAPRSRKLDLARTRSLHSWAKVEGLESRCLLAVTSTTPVPITAIETQSLTAPVMNFTANDAGPFTSTIDWGDGSPVVAGVVAPIAGGFVVSGTHTYPEDGTFTATVTITDTADATSVSPTTTATINESVLTANASPFSIPENSAAIVTTGLFTDPGSPDPASSFSATIDWGDGTTTPGTVVGAAGSYSVTGSHIYPDEGTHNVITTFFETKDPGFTITTTSVATVTEADTPAGGVFAIPPGGLIEGSSYSGPVLTFTNAGFPTNPAADFTASINWGDGTTTTGTITGPAAGVYSVSGTHAFAEEGSSPISVTITDDAPGTAAATFVSTFTIADAALTASPVAVHGTQGTPLTNVDVATFLDADPVGTATDFVATINWGDGTAVSGGHIVEDAAGTFHVEGSHTYTEEHATPDSIVVSITDNGNGRSVTDPSDSKATATSPATIVQAPLLPVSNAVVGTEGVAIPAGTVLASFTDSGGAGPVGDYSATVDWGDGSGPHPAVVVASGVNFLVESGGAFIYDEAGTFAVTITMTDADPGNPGAVPTTAVTTNAATVKDAALTAAATQPTVNTVESAIFPVPVFGKPIFTGTVGDFTDANTAALTTDFRAVIDWGDGTPNSVGTITQPGGAGTDFIVVGTHTYADSGVNGGTGTYPITVFVDDVDGAKLNIVNTANVADNAIVLTGALNPKSDSGALDSDAITNVRQPNFQGTSEPFSHVTLFETPLAGGATVQIGQTRAGGDGKWSITSIEELADGAYTITASATDQFGVTSTPAPVTITPDLTIATLGPEITGLFFNRLNGQVDFTIKDRSVALNVATLLDSANYTLTKVRGAPIGTDLVTNISVTPAAAAHSYNVAVTFNSGKPIRGGFYLFTIHDTSTGPASVQDIAGNHLDGEFDGSFPSGDGIQGAFVAELEAIHNKIFAPQTVVGTASPVNGGVGGAPKGAVHSGVFTHVVPRGSGTVFAAAEAKLKAEKAAAAAKVAAVKAAAVKAALVHKASVSTVKHPVGPKHKA